LERADLILKIKGIMRKIASNSELEIEENTVFEDIEDWDSLNTVDMEMETESHFNISFEVGEFRELHSVGELIDCINSKLQ
jgi:acyl carrier protein